MIHPLTYLPCDLPDLLYWQLCTNQLGTLTYMYTSFPSIQTQQQSACTCSLPNCSQNRSTSCSVSTKNTQKRTALNQFGKTKIFGGSTYEFHKLWCRSGAKNAVILQLFWAAHPTSGGTFHLEPHVLWVSHQNLKLSYTKNISSWPVHVWKVLSFHFLCTLWAAQTTCTSLKLSSCASSLTTCLSLIAGSNP